MQLDGARFSGTITDMKTRRVTWVPRDARRRPYAPQVAAASQRHAHRCVDEDTGGEPSLVIMRRCYDPTPCVSRQIDFARAAFAIGVPIWGSCWGLQLAVVGLGGSVRRNPRRHL